MNRLRGTRLLPADSPLGWTPYAWLLYLLTFLIDPVIRIRAGTAGAGYTLITLAALALFLAAYFRGYWLRGRTLLWPVGIITAMGVALTPMNIGASVFFVYAGAFAGNMAPTRLAVRTLLCVVLAGAVTAWLAGAPLFFWIVAVGVTLVIGAVNTHFAQVHRAQRRLRLAHDEIEHLAAVAERERIARDLHDVLGHTLSLIVLKAELAVRLVDIDATRAAAEMRDVEDVARKTLQEVRDTIRGYRASLREEVARTTAMLKAGAIEADIDVPDFPLPLPVEETLAFALREAVTNVIRHAGATHCTVRLSAGSDGVVLDVADDGRGGDAGEGEGLRGMRERVEAFGGRIDRGAGPGWSLRVRVPIGSDAAVGPRRRSAPAGVAL